MQTTQLNTQTLCQISSSKKYYFPNVENDVDCIKTWGAQRIHLILKIVVWEIWCVFLVASFSHCVWSLKDVRKTSVKTKAAFFSTSRAIMSNTFSYKVTRSFSLVRVGGWRFPSCQFVTCADDWQLLTLNRTCLFTYGNPFADVIVCLLTLRLVRTLSFYGLKLDFWYTTVLSIILDISNVIKSSQWCVRGILSKYLDVIRTWRNSDTQQLLGVVDAIQSNYS